MIVACAIATRVERRAYGIATAPNLRRHAVSERARRPLIACPAGSAAVLRIVEDVDTRISQAHLALWAMCAAAGRLVEGRAHSRDTRGVIGTLVACAAAVAIARGDVEALVVDAELAVTANVPVAAGTGFWIRALSGDACLAGSTLVSDCAAVAEVS